MRRLPLAKQDLHAPADAESHLKIADGWWDEGEKETGIVQLNSRLCAKQWYEQIVRGATGLTRVKIEKRLAELGDKGSPLEPPKPSGDDRAAAEPVGAAPNLNTKITPANVEQIAIGSKSAKEALEVYLTLLGDDSVSDDAKAAAKGRLPYWQDLAAKDYVRQGTKWVPRDEAQKGHDAADKLLDDAIKMLVTKNGPQARAKLEAAMRVDPADTDSAFLLGILSGLQDRNYSKAATYFAECMRRDPTDRAGDQ